MLNLKTLNHFIMSNGLIKKNDRIIVGVSGGADSVCLLHTLGSLKEALEIRLFVVHINHGIRGAEADRDESFVRSMCEAADTDFISFHFDIPEMAKRQKLGEEEAGRNARYNAFRQTAYDIIRKENISESQVKIAVAHNKNDSAETVLHNLSRGSAISGLKGIPAKNGMLIRPLLAFSRVEIEEYLSLNNIAYMTDSTNLENDYTRNVLRNRVFPILKESVNSNVINNFYKSSLIAAEADEYFEDMARDFCRLYLRDADGDFILDKSALLEKKHIIATYIIRYALKKVLAGCGAGIKDIGMTHIEDIISLAKSQNGKKIDLIYSVKVYNEYNDIRFAHGTGESEAVGNDETEIPDISYGLMDEFDISEIPEDKNKKWFDFDKITENIVRYTSKSAPVKEDRLFDFIRENIVPRRWQRDDLIYIKGGRKSIKKLLTDEKIPARQRGKYMVLAIGTDVLWIFESTALKTAGRISELYKVGNSTKRVLEIKVIRR